MKIHCTKIHNNSIYFEIMENGKVYTAGVTNRKTCVAYHGENCRENAIIESRLFGSNIFSLVKFSSLHDFEKRFIMSALVQARKNKKLGY